jgi:hypothetical protein
MHISASCVKVPSLPSVAKGFASGAELIQNDFVGLGAGRLAGECEDGSLSTFSVASHWFKGTDSVGIVQFIDESKWCSLRSLRDTWL